VYIQEDGSASVAEEFSIYIEGEESITLYEESLITLSRNNIQNWFYKLQLPDLIYHIGGKDVEVDNLAILPEPVQKVYKNGYTTISITYTVLEPKTIKNNESTQYIGLFILEKTKPRTTKYLLNRQAFLNTNDNGDLILSPNTKLTLLLPKNSKITTIYPLPHTLKDSLPPFYVSTISWTKQILPKFTLEFEIEDTLESEIVGFFNSIQYKINEKIQGSEGIPTLIILIIVVVSIVYLHKINKKE